MSLEATINNLRKKVGMQHGENKALRADLEAVAVALDRIDSELGTCLLPTFHGALEAAILDARLIALARPGVVRVLDQVASRAGPKKEGIDR